MVSDELYQKGVEKGIKARKGSFAYWQTGAVSPELKAVSEVLSKALKRDVSIRIFNSNGYDNIVKGSQHILSK